MREMTQTIKRTGLDNIQKDLPALRKIKGTTIAFAVLSLAENHALHMEEVKVAQNPEETPEIVAYRDIINAEYEKHLFKNEKGENLLDQQGKVRLKDPQAFNVVVSNLLKEHPIAEEQLKKHEEAYKAFTNEEITVVYDAIETADLPTDLSAEDIVLLARYWDISNTVPEKLKK